MKSINDQEFVAVSRLPPEDRYGYFIRTVVDWERLWCLGNDVGSVLYGDDHGGEYLPVWCHPRYARACAFESWASSAPKEISLDEFLREWIPDLERTGRSTVVFPTSEQKGLIVPPINLRNDLADEARQYE